MTLYEEHGRVGYPPHCTGIVSERVMQIVGRPAWESAVSSYEGLRLVGGGRSLWVDVKGRIYKLERTRLEELMLEEAFSLGLRFEGRRVTSISREGRVEAGSSSGKFDIVVLAEGYGGSLRKDLSIGFSGAPLRGINAEYSNHLGLKEIQVIFDEKLAPGFFSWLVGAGDVVIAGLASPRPELLGPSLRVLEALFGLRERRRAYGGPVILGPPARELSAGVVHVVGDAGGMNKPLTGGGLYPNSLAAELAVRLYERGVELNEAMSRALEWVASKLRKQYLLSRLLLGSRSVGALVALASMLGWEKALRGVDYDEHEKIPLKALRNLTSLSS